MSAAKNLPDLPVVAAIPVAPKRVDRRIALTVNLPEAFTRADFYAWINAGQGVATWHTRGQEPGEFSDVFFLVTGGYDGSEAGAMPDDIWKQICDLVYAELGVEDQTIQDSVLVHLTNLPL